MSKIEDSVSVKTSPAKAYEALTRPDGYRAWWSKNCAIAEQVGRESMLHFDKGGTPVTMRYRVDALDANAHVRWSCVAHDMPSWIGTTLDWTIAPAGERAEIRLVHAGWKDPPPEMVAQGWKHFLGSLRAYLETGAGEPW